MLRLTFISLLLLTMMLSAASAQGGISNCCLKISDTYVHRDRLTDYYKQLSPSCTLHAVVFTTVRNIRICADPKHIWTKTSMAFLDGKNWQQEQVTRNRRRH